jgi:hypothetical protein
MKRLFLAMTALLCLSASAANAQTSNCKPFDFNLAPSYQLGQNAFAYTTDDFNGDGKLDISVINGEVKTVSVLFGDGAGGFGAPQIFPTEINPWSVASGDLNSDGKSDLIVGSFYENKLAVLLNDGRGGFLAPNVVNPPASFGQYLELKAADFNGDGKTDVAALARQDGKQLKIFLGNGQGDLILASTLNLGGRESVMEVGFINDDNLPDIIATSGDAFTPRSVNIIYGQQSGNFTAASYYMLPLDAFGIDIADYNGDGRDDLAVAIRDYNTNHFIQVWINNGNGSFTGSKINIFYFLPPTDVTSADFNGDGKLDLAVPTGTSMIVFYGDGTGAFPNRSYWTIPGGTKFAFAADVNGDNKKDLVALQSAYATNNSAIVFINDNNSGFRTSKLVPWGTSDLAAADLNGDNFKDFISSTDTDFYTSEVVVALNDKNGGLQPDSNFAIPAGSRTLKTGDFNGDGKTDVVTAHSYFNSRQVTVLLGNGTGSLAVPPVATTLSAGVENIVAGDFNRDNKDDVFALGQNGTGYVLLSNGNGGFTVAAEFPSLGTGNAFNLEKGDFNNDGNLDVVFSIDSTFGILTGDGTGRFTRTAAQTFGGASYMAVGDVNGDRNLDIIGLSSSFSTVITIILGNGSGGFGDNYTQIINGGGLSLAVADFNGDGFSDVAFASSINEGSLAIVPGSGTAPHLGTPIFYPVATLTRVFAADYNNDNKPDIGFASANAARGVIYNNSAQIPCLSINDVTVTEGNSGTATAAFTVTLSSPATETVRVNYSLEGRSTVVGTDLQNVSGRLEIPAGQTSATINVPIMGDLLDEFDEDFAVNLASASNAFLTKSVGIGTIRDDDAEPTITINDVTQQEPVFSGGFTFRVSLSAPSEKPISLRYSTADGTAVGGKDYYADSRTASIQPGSTYVDIGTSIVGDSMFEADETFFINLSDPTNAVISDSQGKGTILNDDPIPTVNFFASGAVEGDTGVTTRTITLQLSNPTDQLVTLNLATSGGTALKGKDYVAVDTTLVFLAEQQTITAELKIIGDTINEPNETFNVNLSGISNATATTTQVSFTIIDDDQVPNDFDRDGKTDLAVFRPTDRTWYILFSSTGNFTSFQYGLSTDVLVSGDYNNDGRTDYAVWRPSTGGWYTNVPNRSQIWGKEADLPVPGDYDNDGRIDVAVFRPSDKTWYIRLSSNGTFKILQFGLETDKPVPADYDGDGKTDIAVFRPSTGYWYILRSSDDSMTSSKFGVETDRLVPADYDGDGKADIAVFRDGYWYYNRSSNNEFTAFKWGIAGDKPVPGNYDGDDKIDFAVYRTGVWYIWLSSTNSFSAKQFGLPDDTPIPFVSNN